MTGVVAGSQGTGVLDGHRPGTGVALSKVAPSFVRPLVTDGGGYSGLSSVSTFATAGLPLGTKVIGFIAGERTSGTYLSLSVSPSAGGEVIFQKQTGAFGRNALAAILFEANGANASAFMSFWTGENQTGGQGGATPAVTAWHAFGISPINVDVLKLETGFWGGGFVSNDWALSGLTLTPREPKEIDSLDVHTIVEGWLLSDLTTTTPNTGYWKSQNGSTGNNQDLGVGTIARDGGGTKGSVPANTVAVGNGNVAYNRINAQLAVGSPVPFFAGGASGITLSSTLNVAAPSLAAVGQTAVVIVQSTTSLVAASLNAADHPDAVEVFLGGDAARLKIFAVPVNSALLSNGVTIENLGTNNNQCSIHYYDGMSVAEVAAATVVDGVSGDGTFPARSPAFLGQDWPELTVPDGGTAIVGFATAGFSATVGARTWSGDVSEVGYFSSSVNVDLGHSTATSNSIKELITPRVETSTVLANLEMFYMLIGPPGSATSPYNQAALDLSPALHWTLNSFDEEADGTADAQYEALSEASVFFPFDVKVP